MFIEHDERINHLAIRLFFTTKRLLSIALKANHIAIDPTYKLVWQGYPVIQVGSTDKQKHYQPFGLAVCDSEEDIDFDFIFSSLLKLVPGFHPTILLADGSHAITNAFFSAFINDLNFHRYIRVQCWVHMLRNVEKRLKNESFKTHRCEIVADIKLI